MLARVLYDCSTSFTQANIKRSFFRSGIYPFSINHFLLSNQDVRDIPDNVFLDAMRAIEEERNANMKKTIDQTAQQL